MNPNVNKGDRIVCYHMEGEISVPPGTRGTVKSVTRDPFEPEGEVIINVNWDNGSSLALLSSTDYWKMDKDQIKEDVKLPFDYQMMKKNPHLLKDFDWKFLKEYLETLRLAGPVNMFEAAPFLYSGKEWIDRYYGEDREDSEDFQKLLEMADTARDKMIAGTVKYLQRTKKDDWDIDDANTQIKRLSKDLLSVFFFMR